MFANKIVYIPVFIKIVLLAIGAGVINVSQHWHQDIGQHPSRYVSGYSMYLHATQKKWWFVMSKAIEDAGELNSSNVEELISYFHITIMISWVIRGFTTAGAQQGGYYCSNVLALKGNFKDTKHIISWHL